MTDFFTRDDCTPVPDAFIDVYMPKAERGVYALVYIMGCRFASSGLDATIGGAAERLGVPAADVLEAWRFWEGLGIVKVRGDGMDAVPELLPLSKPGKIPVPVTKEAAVRVEKAPTYTPEAIERVCREDKDARYLFGMAERMLAKPLTYSELNALFSFYDWLRLSPAVIEVLLDYCITNGHRGVRYMEKVAMDWADNGIETVEEAEAYVRLFNSDFREIMKAFGHARREPAAGELAYMKKWLKQYYMPVDVIKAACDKTVMQIGEPKFSYADAILAKWHDAGVRTLGEIERIEESFYQSKDSQNAEKRPRGRAAAKPKNRFNNYEPRRQDLDSLAAMEQAYIDKKLTGGI